MFILGLQADPKLPLSTPYGEIVYKLTTKITFKNLEGYIKKTILDGLPVF